MRSAFIKNLIKCARSDNRIWLLVGDLGYSVVEPFRDEFPDRFINMGIAEQNMAGVAAGLALSGKIVFIYSIANFPTLRCLEQIRNDICYHNLNVKIVAVGGGLSYGAQGVTHHATEDLAIMRALPNMTVIAPGDPIEASLATRSIIEWQGPCYLRLGKNGENIIHEELQDFKIGKALLIQNGNDITLIGIGAILYNTLKAGEKLSQIGIKTRVLSMPTLKPLDIGAILSAAQETRCIITVEEHSPIGGLGSAVAEILAEQTKLSCNFKKIALKHSFVHIVGSQEYLRNKFGLSTESIYQTVQSFFPEKSIK